MTIFQVLATEFQKLRRSKVTWLSLLGYALLPLMGGLFMWIVADPRRAAKLGLLGAKSDLLGLTATWQSYFQLMVQIGLVGTILLSVMAAYVFGREYTERTAKNMLALPIGRHWFVIAKLAVVLAWFAAVCAAVLAEAFVVGLLLRLPGLTQSVAAHGIIDVLRASMVSFLLVPVVAWIATLGKGYLPPLGFAILMLLLASFVGKTGWGKWFPWSIVPMLSGVAGERAQTLPWASVAIAGLTFVAGTAAAIAQLRWADNTQ